MIIAIPNYYSLRGCSYRKQALVGLYMLLVLLYVPSTAIGQIQQQPGLVPYQSYDQTNFDTVDIAGGAIQLHIPIISYPQKGALPPFGLEIIYNTPQWIQQAVPNGNNSYVQWYFTSPNTSGLVLTPSYLGGQFPDGKDSSGNQLYGNTVQDETGASHEMLGVVSPSGIKTSVYETMDGSGIQYTGAAFINRDGITMTPACSAIYHATCPSQTAAIMRDRSGNEVTVSPSGAITDSVGRAFPLYSNMSLYNAVAKCESQQYPVVNGMTEPITICWQQYTATSAFGQANVHEGTATFVAISSVTLQNRASWSFTYDSWGFLQSVTTPTGAVMTYMYYPNNPMQNVGSRFLQSRTLNVNGTMSEWSYTYSTVAGPGNTTEAETVVTDSLGNTVTHLFSGGGESQTVYKQGSAQTLLKTVQRTYVTLLAGFGTAYLPKQTTTIYPTGQSTTLSSTSCVIYDNNTNTTCTGTDGVSSSGLKAYDPNDAYRVPGSTPYSAPLVVGSPLYSYVYDYTSGSGTGSLLKQTVNTYQWQANDSYRSANLLNLVASTAVSTGGAALTTNTFTYDEAAYGPSGVLGNLTTEVDGGLITKHSEYNASGMITASIDGLGTTTITYDGTGAYPQTVQHPTINGVAHLDQYVYDTNTGLMESHKDWNNLTTSYGYDVMRRQNSISYPDGGSESYLYTDEAPNPFFTYTKAITSGASSQSYSTLTTADALGRVIHNQVTSDSNADTVDTVYNLLGLVQSVSNPHGSSSNPTTDGLTTYAYDGLGRLLTQTQPDSSTLQWCYNGLANAGQTFCLANKSSKTAETWVDALDENGNHPQRVTDALGRLTAVMEADPVSNASSLETDYSYDANSALLRVDQWGGPVNTAGERVRVFTYDSLSRLLTATNPESGMVCYGPGTGCTNGYDANGNLLTKIDARGIKTTYSYDVLNRLTSKHYSDNTPTAYYTWDANLSGAQYENYPAGNVGDSWTSLNPSSTATSEINDPQAVTESISRYDQVGRPLSTYHGLSGNYGIPAGTTNDYLEGAGFAYNLAGGLSQSLTYESVNSSPVIVINYRYDGANRLNSLTVDPTSSGLPATLPTTLFQATSYSVFGLTGANLAISSQSNNPAITLSQSFDKRSRSTSSIYLTGAGAVSGSGVTLYSYGSPSLLTYDGVGNVKTFTDTVTGGVTAYYDHMNRLSSSSASSGNCKGLVDTWTYSVFGNRYTEAFSGTSNCTVPTSPSLSYNSNSQITNNGYTYDKSGNVTFDGVNGYAYDAEGRLCAYHNGLTNAFGVYVYDPFGFRAAKGTISPSGNSVTSALCTVNANNFSVTSTYAYDPSGNIIEEFSGGIWQNTNINANGKLLASYSGSGLDYAMSDWLGTKHAQITSDGNAANLLYFGSAPFGDGYQTIGTPATATDIQYTGKEQDAETNNNIDFGPRYYKPSTGRFLSPDPSDLTFADPLNPQSFNLYAYANNNPLNNIDPSGLACDDSASFFQDFQAATDPTNGNLIQTETVSGGCNSDSFLLGLSNAGNGGKQIMQQTPAPSKPNILLCAAKYGSAHSVASLLGLGNNYVANLFGGNSVSGLVNLGNSIFGGGPPPDFAKMALGGASLGLPINNIRTFTGGGSITGLNGATGYVRGQALQGIFNAATESGAIPSIAAEGGEIAVQGGLSAGEFASGVGIAKFVVDAATFGAGLVSCAAN